jgi:chromosome segregation protein
MRLTDEENTAESGIDIVASPPGKKLQNVLLLSGGEKALTALALLVGIFEYSPAPFCVLDEVDAPLDEANVGRLAEMLKSMSAETQFLLVTHSKRMMTAADLIYGVTMQEPGVSKLVSVRLGAEEGIAKRPREHAPERRLAMV